MKTYLNKLEPYKSFIKSPYLSTKHLSYFDTYHQLFKDFRGKKITFVEIGILDGGSLFMWRDYFGENARIIGIEYNKEALKWKKFGFEIFIGDQSSERFWKNFFLKVGHVDIVLDDGGHTNEQQILTAVNCISNINDKGILVTEDTHTSYQMKFGNPSKYSFIEWAKIICDNVNSRCKGINQSNLVFNKYVHSVRFFESIVAFYIDREKCFESKPIRNKRKLTKAKDYRYFGTSLANIKFKSKFRFWFVNKYRTLKLEKYFKN